MATFKDFLKKHKLKTQKASTSKFKKVSTPKGMKSPKIPKGYKGAEFLSGPGMKKPKVGPYAPSTKRKSY